MAGAHVQIYLWTFDRGWPQEYIIQKCLSGIYDVNVEGNSLVMCSWPEGAIAKTVMRRLRAGTPGDIVPHSI
jgi:hypothetical protein